MASWHVNGSKPHASTAFIYLRIGDSEVRFEKLEADKVRCSSGRRWVAMRQGRRRCGSEMRGWVLAFGVLGAEFARDVCRLFPSGYWRWFVI